MAGLRFLSTIRFDTSDEHVFEHAAEQGEWAVSGAFAFAGAEQGSLTGKARQAFANGFLGLGSFGRSTFASVAEISDRERAAIERVLARHLVADYGAPDEDTALPAAREEVEFVIDLCAESLINTVFTVRRHFDEEGGIREEFRTIQAPTSQPMHSRIWNVVDDET
jgi:hypothetical protein